MPTAVTRLLQRVVDVREEEVRALLTADQAETYDKLPAWSRSMLNPGYVSPPGQEGEAIRTNLQELFRGFQERRRRR